MKHIFYSLTVIALIYELMVATNIVKMHSFLLSMKAYKKETATTSQKNWVFLNIVYMIWAFVGLFTSQWLIFVTIIVLSFINKKYIAHRFLDAIFTSILLLFIILNAYHFHIDVNAEIFKWLNK